MKAIEILEKVEVDESCWKGYKQLGMKKKGKRQVPNCVPVKENMDHSKDGQAVPELKAALVAKKSSLQTASDEQVYNTIDKIMTRIAKSHGISGQKLHDMWVERYGQIPDTWIMK